MAAGQHKGSCALPLGGGGPSRREGLDCARQRPSIHSTSSGEPSLGTNGEGVSRRALLGAAAALPLLPLEGGGWVGVEVALGGASEAHHSTSESTPTLPSPLKGEERWRRALARFERAEAAARAWEGRVGATHAKQHALEEAYGERLDVMYAMLRRLMRAPAPDLAALGRKIVLAVDHEVATLWRGEACMAAVKRDALRLCCA